MTKQWKTTFGQLGVFFILWCIAFPAWSGTLTATVLAVRDGDTFTVQKSSGTVFKVRLREVDAPELKQTMGKQARQFAHDLIFGKEVQIQYDLTDKYDRLVAWVTLPDGRSLNEEMVRGGFAWHYRVHRPANEVLAHLEYAAWKGKLGLWVDTESVPPWKFRREARIPDPPETSSEMDYDLIFSYGLVGNVKTKTYLWPACAKYPKPSPNYVFFDSRERAEQAGYKPGRHCPTTPRQRDAGP